MIRLALVGQLNDPAASARAAARLRGGRFTVIVDDDARSAENTASAFSASVATASFDKLLTELAGEFDAIVFHGQSEPDLLRRVVAAGKHLLTDLRPDDASSILTACDQARVRLMVARAARFSPAALVLKESVDAGKLGKPSLLRIHRWKASGDPPSSQSLVHQTIDDIDLANWFFGERPSEVFAARHEDYLQLHLGFTGGGMAMLDTAQTLPRGDSYYSMSIIGTQGAAYSDDHHNRQLLFGGDRPAALAEEHHDASLLPMWQEFVAAIAENREPSVPGSAGAAALQVAAAAAESLAAGTVMRLQGDIYAS